MGKIYVYPQSEFDKKVKAMGLDDSNVEQAKNKAFISIIGTKECLKYYLHDDTTKHYFEKNHANVLNLDFDDIDEDVKWEGHDFKSLTMEQAFQTLDFLEENLKDGPKDIYIHCKAGISRSQAFAAFVYDAYKALYGHETHETMNRANLNHGALRTLKKAFYERNKMII